jgi:drug/metabolite transporter (DMT)-like permease
MGNQYLAEKVAHVLMGRAFGLSWLESAVRSPFAQAWAGLEVITLGVWMVVLYELELSAAFPMTAVGYLLVIGMGWTLFGEPVTASQLAGSLAILVGVWLLGDQEAEA